MSYSYWFYCFCSTYPYLINKVNSDNSKHNDDSDVSWLILVKSEMGLDSSDRLQATSMDWG